jgi:hypothetical protein
VFLFTRRTTRRSYHGAAIAIWSSGGLNASFGIVLRTKLSQDLHFYPFLWKYIAGERLGVPVDPELGDMFK